MILYYSWKYAMYNLTFYESSAREYFCYLWRDGKMGANEEYLGHVNEVALYCNSCHGQNKNRQMLAMVFCFLKDSRNVVSVSISYLITGHTFIHVYSIHGSNEYFTKKKTIWAPSECPTIVRNSIIMPGPYNVIVLAAHSERASKNHFTRFQN
ncbi:hypothetical protein PR048_011489 [Dryococelus australis]|uniref:Uncharacterized protein n=1 Tax=Dryococelus australis TaxID=614101 RepID=A0ABQ9HM27_9NEOP|nr:hypothetical protein PR048_011489 [Dryococelus australis]